MKKLFALVSILIIVSASCRPEGGMNADAGYFSITALRDSLIKGKPVYNFQKTLVVDGKSETQLINDSLHLQIHFFEDFEINKPSYKGAYIVDTLNSTPDSAGALVHRIEYKRKPEFKYPVTFSSYTDKSNGTKIISITSEVVNLLTVIRKELTIEINNTGFVKYSYSITQEFAGKINRIGITLERVY
ncbi:MAG: hypothetical protein M0D57_20325 [Sphingobacteriales bacterium JAD_PAG50586_3]|nr:MAG: hypothetical protein M0D57_20325 [Sphingobacteriales bacterium JAD_PAG50586_3]